jgi:hypothetical protein
VDRVRHRFQQVFKELPRRSPVSLVDKLGDREFTRAVDADEQVELAFGSLNLGDIHVKEADQVALETLSPGLVALDVRQTGYAVPLQAAVQRWSWRSRDVLVPYGFLPFQRKDRTITVGSNT